MPMTLIGPDGTPKATFSELPIGDLFQYAGRTYLKCSAHIPSSHTIHSAGGMMTHFGVRVDDGSATLFADNCSVLRVEGTLRLCYRDQS